MDIGVLGGTFDPVHNGHLIVAEEARVRLSLAEVIFVPAGQPWLKANKPVLAAAHRVQMVRLAIAGKSYFRLSAVEVERPGPSYTVDTITELQGQLGAGNELFFIIGPDALSQLPAWKEPARLIRICRLVAVPRPGCPLPDVDSLEKAVPGLSRRLILLDKPEVDIDATDIRSRAARGLPISHLVPEPVDEYIKENKLYRDGGWG